MSEHARTITQLTRAAAILCLIVSSAAPVFAAVITYGPLAALEDPETGSPPTSATIVWRTDTATASNTAYVGPSASGPWTFTGVDANVSDRHEVLITGLAAEATYYVYVESDGAISDPVEFATGLNLLTNGSFESWHAVSGEDWGAEEPDGWHGWEIYPWDPGSSGYENHITIQMDRDTGLPSPLVRHLSHRASMDEGWRTCYGGLYQEVTGLPPGEYIVSGWAAWLYSSVSNTSGHKVEILAKDGPHSAGVEPTGTVIFEQDGSVWDTRWKYVQGTVECTTGTVTIYADLRADAPDGSAFAHFDGLRLMAAEQSVVHFENFASSYAFNGSTYDIAITYDTVIPTTTQIEWGPTTSYGSTSVEDPALVTQHTVQIMGVQPSVVPYHYRARATAPGDISEISRDQTFDAPEIAFSAISASVDTATGTTCTIHWNTNYPTTTNKAYYRKVGDVAYTAAQSPSDPAAALSHSVTLVALDLDTEYEYHLESGASGIPTATSAPDKTFQTPAQPGSGLYFSFAMVGGSILDGGDDVGPGDDWEDLMRYEHPYFNLMGLGFSSWATCEPAAPGPDGIHHYDWSSVDANMAKAIPGKSKRGYYQMWGTSPGWAGDHTTPGFWEGFEAFVEEQTVYINENFGEVWVVFENEPNISRAPDGWHWADWYIYCLEHFYNAMHRASARTGMDNKVIAGNLAGHSAGGYDELYQRGLKNMSDVLGAHPYPANIRDGVKVEDLARIHEYMENYGDSDKKILVTEGWGSGRSAGFDRSSPLIEPTAMEIENMWYGMAKGFDNLMTPIPHWDPSYLLGVSFFCANDNWGAMGWRKRAIPQKNESGDITGFIVDGYPMTPDIAPTFWNGGMYDFYGNSKDVLHLLFPGNGLVFMNPGFEVKSGPPNDHTPHFWITQDDPAPTANYALDDVIYRSGSRCLRLSQTADAWRGLYQLTAKRSASAGISYRARVWCKTEDVSNVAGKFYMRFCNLDGSLKSAQCWAANVTGTSDWTEMQVMAVAPSYTSRIEVGCYMSGVGTVRFDDVTISASYQQEMGVVKGYTLDEDQVPVPHSIVSTTTGGFQTVSDASGYYEMTGVATGTYDFICRKPGYVPFRAKNQTVAAGKTSFVMFCMGHPKPGLSVTDVQADAASAQPGEPINVTVTVNNTGQYPVNVGDVGLFMEAGADDATGSFTIYADPYNPETIPAFSSEYFYFAATPRTSATGLDVNINAYAFAQEDRPNMLRNGGLDEVEWNHHWSWDAETGMTWSQDQTQSHSPPNSLRCTINRTNTDGTFNWANNWSAWGPTVPIPAKPNTSYTIGCYHKDQTDLNTAILVFIQEYYYDGSKHYYNGRKFIGVPKREAWADDCLIYLTGDPNVTQGLYATNRLLASLGPATTGLSQGITWWDDLYLKETGNWLADDRADTGAEVVVAERCATLAGAFAHGEGTVVKVDETLVVTAGAESFADRVYVQSQDRAVGILLRLEASETAPNMGDLVTVSGTIGSVDGEKALLDARVTPAGP